MHELSGLPLFAKIVELNSFAEAARQLQLPATTLSRKIQQLESELGGKLLNRTTRSLSLTELGERVLPKALLIQQTVKELQEEAEHISTQATGKLHIAAPRAFSVNILAPLLSQFRQQHPGIRIELDASNRFQDLTKGSLDFVFRIGELADSSLIALPLTQVDYELVASPQLLAHHADPQGPGHPRDLQHYPSIRNHVDGFILPWHLHKQGEVYQHQSEPDLLSDDLQVSLMYALDGVGIAYLPYSLVYRPLQDGRLVTLLDEWQRHHPTAYLIYPDRAYLPQKSKLFLQFIKAQLPHFQQRLTKPGHR